MHKVLLATVIFSVAILAGCSNLTPMETPAPAPLVGEVIPVGQPETRDLAPTREVVPNCGGGNATIVKHPSMTVLTSHVVEWEVGGQTGIGVTIGKGAIPGGVDLSAALESYITRGNESGFQQSTGWDLPAEASTIMEYTLMWREVWQPGYVEVRAADQSVYRVNVRYRTGVQSEIIGQRGLNCDGSALESAQPPTARPGSSSDTASQQDIYNCAFITELLQKSQVNQILMGSRGAAGVQARLVQAVDVPIGWTVHKDGVTFEGPVHFDVGTFASFWGPWQCEPMSIDQ